nr:MULTISPECIES: hypothetical protein [Bacillus cereus group]
MNILKNYLIDSNKLIYFRLKEENKFISKLCKNVLKVILSPDSRQLRGSYFTVYYEGDFFEIRRTFLIDFKMKAIELYSHRGIGSELFGKELGVIYSVIDR